MKTSKRHTRTARNSSGRITVYHRGGGSKRLLRAIDWKQKTEGIVRQLEYDPNRSAHLALIEYKIGPCPKEDKQTLSGPTAFSYRIATEGLQVNDRIASSLPLKSIPIGTSICLIELRPGQGGQLVRSAGTFAQLIQKSDKHALVRLPSGKVKQLNAECRASIGTVSNSSHFTRKLKKAGQTRWLGIRPTVRGVAMNPIDHPHGGGGGKPSVSPWGKPTK